MDDWSVRRRELRLKQEQRSKKLMIDATSFPDHVFRVFRAHLLILLRHPHYHNPSRPFLRNPRRTGECFRLVLDSSPSPLRFPAILISAGSGKLERPDASTSYRYTRRYNRFTTFPHRYCGSNPSASPQYTYRSTTTTYLSQSSGWRRNSVYTHTRKRISSCRVPVPIARRPGCALCDVAVQVDLGAISSRADQSVVTAAISQTRACCTVVYLGTLCAIIWSRHAALL